MFKKAGSESRKSMRAQGDHREGLGWMDVPKGRPKPIVTDF